MIKEALVLAGGRGIRLHPITKDLIPKSLVEIAPKISMLDYTIEGLVKIGVKKIVVTTFHLSNQIESYLNKQYRNRSDFKLSIFKENIELGSGGSMLTLIRNGQTTPFLVVSSDTFIKWEKAQSFLAAAAKKIDISRAVFGVTNDIKNSQAPLNAWFKNSDSLLVSYRNRISEDVPEEVKELKSKPELYTNITGSGIIVINPKFINIDGSSVKYPVCLYGDWLPIWAKKQQLVYVSQIDSIVLDMGTPERLRLAKKLFYETTLNCSQR